MYMRGTEHVENVAHCAGGERVWGDLAKTPRKRDLSPDPIATCPK